MGFKDSFQREMLALRVLAREAVERNPALEPFLGTPGADPDVERLLEGFSFLAGRLQEKIDDELPEITQGLFGMLWPNYLRPVPAASIIQYQVTENATGASIIPRGTLVESLPVDGTACRFRTVYDTGILPLRVADLRIFERNGTAILALRFAVTNGSLHSLPLSRLRVFFTGEDSIPCTLYFQLTHRLQELRFVIRDREFRENVTAVLPPSCVRPLGFEENEGMCPYPRGLALGYRVVQEYFCFPEKFLFVDITELDQGLNAETRRRFSEAEEFELHFVLPALPERYESFRARHWQLFCTPVVNVFPFETAPQTVVRNRSGHRIIPDANHPDALAVYSVEKVSTWVGRGRSGTFSDTAMRSFADQSATGTAIRYRVDVRPGPGQEDVETYLVVDGPGKTELSIKLQLLCTNGLLPKRLGIGDIRVAAESAGTTAAPFRNILPVSVPLPPPCGDDILWKLLSNMRLTSIALTDVPTFQAMLAVYAFRAAGDRMEAQRVNRQLQGIRAIASPSTDRLFNGIPRRGGRTTIVVDQGQFSCEGAMYLFGCALNEFLGMYATANSFHQLIFKEALRGEEYVWPARLGSLISS